MADVTHTRIDAMEAPLDADHIARVGPEVKREATPARRAFGYSSSAPLRASRMRPAARCSSVLD